jgi:hypothetical protein
VAQEKPDHFFPLMKDLIKDRPQVPPAYGVALAGNWVDTDWKFTSAAVGINDANVPAEQVAANSGANIRVGTVGVKADVWVLPFFNLFATVGNAEAKNQLVLRNAPIKFIPPGIGQPAQVVRGDVVVDFDLNGPYGTIGGVFAGGYKKFFASVDFSATNTNFGKKDLVHGEQSATYSVAARVGYAFGLSQIWLGGRYLDYSTHYYGNIPIPSGQNFAFDVGLKTASWNYSGGIRTVLQEHWEMLIEVGAGERHMITSTVGYRW